MTGRKMRDLFEVDSSDARIDCAPSNLPNR
jgi:hypothetical protein